MPSMYLGYLGPIILGIILFLGFGLVAYIEGIEEGIARRNKRGK